MMAPAAKPPSRPAATPAPSPERAGSTPDNVASTTTAHAARGLGAITALSFGCGLQAESCPLPHRLREICLPKVTVWKIGAHVCRSHTERPRTQARSLPPCGGGPGGGRPAKNAQAATPLPVPPPQGGRERWSRSVGGYSPFATHHAPLTP